jgi:hypothetical protein
MAIATGYSPEVIRGMRVGDAQAIAAELKARDRKRRQRRR